MAELNGEGDLAVRLSSTNQPPVIRIGGSGRLTVGAVVEAVADAVDTSGASAVDLTTLAALLQEAVREGVSAGLAAQRVDEQTPMFGGVGRFLNANQGLLTLVALIVGVLALLNDRVSADPPDPPPSVTVQVERSDRAEVERIVEQRLREQEQREQEQGDGEPAPG